MKKVCKKCRYWTKNPSHGAYKCYTNQCPAKQRDEREKPKRAAKLTDSIILQLAELFRFSIMVKLSKKRTITCVRVRSLVNRKTLTKGKEYWALSQMQLKGWYCDREVPVFSMVGDLPLFGPRDYSPKNFKILDTHKIPFERVAKLQEVR